MAALTLALAQVVMAAAPDQKTTTLPAKKFVPTGKPIDPANMDPSVKPGVDFYRYANGKWLEKNPVPASESRWGAFSELAERNSQILYDILEESAKKTDAAKGTPAQMVGDFYATAIDSAKADALGAKPLDELMGRIAAVKTTDDVLKEIAHLQTLGARMPFAVFASPDAKQSTQVILQVVQAGLGMPDRDYYTRTDEASVKLRDQYQAHMGRMFGLLGDDATTAAANAKTVMGIETQLANASLTRVQRRDPEANYHKMTVDELSTLTPALQWPRLLDGMGITERSAINVGQPEFVKQVNTMMTTVPVADWRAYMRWHVVRQAADLLSSPFVNESFDFYGRTLNGTKEIRPRWKRARDLVDGSIGEALGQLYVERTFTPQAKTRALQLVENLRAELRDRLTKLDWMSDATRQQALRKLEAFSVKIGYPDVWRDYSTLTIDRSSLVANVLRSTQFEYKRNMAKLGKPVDRKEWGMTPPTVNAYYNPRLNEIVFPAGILQPPFFDANADDPVNYGGIGTVIGHEMTHGFDDQGRKSDADGNLKDWWTPEDAEKYKARSALIEKQYASYTVLDTLHINGKLTLGENTADIGGASIAYGAMKKALAGKKPVKIDGFTPEQRFFLSFAQIWRNNIRPEALRVRINTDSHSPGEYRCIGTLSNMPEFAQAFGLKEGDPMVRNEIAKIW
ncbi:MAG TPA: M13 family metallopeptidase [Candidatus Eisenbacteria bacterium]|nr:M13 family metallopeptidase [Candidatus Eisenbacteria bacterium]